MQPLLFVYFMCKVVRNKNKRKKEVRLYALTIVGLAVVPDTLTSAPVNLPPYAS